MRGKRQVETQGVLENGLTWGPRSEPCPCRALAALCARTRGTLAGHALSGTRSRHTLTAQVCGRAFGSPLELLASGISDSAALACHFWARRSGAGRLCHGQCCEATGLRPGLGCAYVGGEAQHWREVKVAIQWGPEYVPRVHALLMFSPGTSDCCTGVPAAPPSSRPARICGRKPPSIGTMAPPACSSGQKNDLDEHAPLIPHNSAEAAADAGSPAHIAGNQSLPGSAGISPNLAHARQTRPGFDHLCGDDGRHRPSSTKFGATATKFRATIPLFAHLLTQLGATTPFRAHLSDLFLRILRGFPPRCIVRVHSAVGRRACEKPHDVALSGADPFGPCRRATRALGKAQLPQCWASSWNEFHCPARSCELFATPSQRIAQAHLMYPSFSPVPPPSRESRVAWRPSGGAEDCMASVLIAALGSANRPGIPVACSSDLAAGGAGVLPPELDVRDVDAGEQRIVGELWERHDVLVRFVSCRTC